MAGLDPAIHVFVARTITILASMLVLAGCTSYRPTDVTLISVKATDSYDREFAEYEQARTSTKTIKTKINGVDRELTWFQLAEEIGRPVAKPEHRLWLQIDFSTATDLWELSRGNSLGASVYPCGQKPDAAIIPAEAVRQAGLPLSYADRQPRSDGMFSFNIPVSVSSPISINNVDQGWKYDFRTKPEDICFELRGGNNGGFGYHSNTVKVSAQAIAAALRELPPYFRQ